MANRICTELGYLMRSGSHFVKGFYPEEFEDWNHKQGEGEYLYDDWKMIVNYNTHDISIRHVEPKYGIVFEWKFKNCKDFDNSLVRLEYYYD